MLRRRPPDELGELVEVHRPLHPVLGWGLIAVTTLVGPVFEVDMRSLWNAPWSVVLIFYAALFLLLAFVFAPWALLEHRLYEHGIVFRTMLIGTPIFVVPHYSIRPNRIEARPRRRRDAADGGNEGRPHRRRCVVGREHVRLYGLDQKFARLLGKGKLSWTEAGRQGTAIPLSGSYSNSRVSGWEADYRDPERHMELIAVTVHASQERFPYFNVI